MAAVQNKSQNRGQKNKNKNNQQNKGGQNKPNQTGQSGQKPDRPKPYVNDDKLCKLHAKWKENANFCAAPWACRMKDIFKAPQ